MCVVHGLSGHIQQNIAQVQPHPFRRAARHQFDDEQATLSLRLRLECFGQLHRLHAHAEHWPLAFGNGEELCSDMTGNGNP